MGATGSTFVGATFGAALTWVQTEYGYLAHEVENFVTVPPLVPTKILTQNGDRLGFAIINTTPAAAFIGMNATFAGNLFGVFLGGNGGSFTSNVRQDLTFPSRELWAQGQTNQTQLYVLEIIGWKKLPPGTEPGY